MSIGLGSPEPGSTELGAAAGGAGLGKGAPGSLGLAGVVPVGPARMASVEASDELASEHPAVVAVAATMTAILLVRSDW